MRMADAPHTFGLRAVAAALRQIGLAAAPALHETQK